MSIAKQCSYSTEFFSASHTTLLVTGDTQDTGKECSQDPSWLMGSHTYDLVLKNESWEKEGGWHQELWCLSSQIAVILPSFIRIIFFSLCMQFLPSLLNCHYLNSQVSYFNLQILSPIPRRGVRSNCVIFGCLLGLNHITEKS